MPNPLLTRRAVVLAKIETTYNTDPTPTPTVDALLCEDPDYKVDPTVLERNFSRNSLSRLAHKVGRKLASFTFSHELRGGGSAASAARLGRLLRMCGFSETAITSGASQVSAVVADQANTNPTTLTWGSAASGSLPTEPVMFTLEVTTAGASGTAKMTVTPDANAVASSYAAAISAAVVTSGSAFTLKTGVTITPTFTGSFVLGAKYYVWWFPAGYRYDPVSSGYESGTIYGYFDGLLHKLTGARGTFTVDGQAGQYGKVTFTFTGQYVAPTDASLPTTSVYETTLPPIFENAKLYINGIAAVVDKVTFDAGVEVVPRADANSSDGYNGVIIVDRMAKGGIDPEMQLVADENFWLRLANSTIMPFRTRFGSVIGNQIWLLGPAVQYTGLTYQSRDSLRVLDAALAFNQFQSGDDEVILFFG